MNQYYQKTEKSNTPYVHNSTEVVVGQHSQRKGGTDARPAPLSAYSDQMCDPDPFGKYYQEMLELPEYVANGRLSDPNSAADRVHSINTTIHDTTRVDVTKLSINQRLEAYRKIKEVHSGKHLPCSCYFCRISAFWDFFGLDWYKTKGNRFPT